MFRDPKTGEVTAAVTAAILLPQLASAHIDVGLDSGGPENTREDDDGAMPHILDGPGSDTVCSDPERRCVDVS